jgi:hypothetical protein
MTKQARTTAITITTTATTTKKQTIKDISRSHMRMLRVGGLVLDDDVGSEVGLLDDVVGDKEGRYGKQHSCPIDGQESPNEDGYI